MASNLMVISDGLQPLLANGLQATRDGLRPLLAMAANLLAMASDLPSNLREMASKQTKSDGLQPKSRLY